MSANNECFSNPTIASFCEANSINTPRYTTARNSSGEPHLKKSNETNTTKVKIQVLKDKDQLTERHKEANKNNMTVKINN